MRTIGMVGTIAVGLSMAWTAAAAFERVRFPGPDGVTLAGALYRPAGAGPFPAVVALHGCGGLDGRDGNPAPRHADWGERLAAQGFLVLFPDSFGSRGLPAQCRTRDRAVRPSRERVGDAFAARAWLAARSDVQPAAITLLGWSNGGSTVLYAMRKEARLPAGGDFAKAVAFYPGCRMPDRHGAYAARKPLLILIGAADDWTPAPPCAALARDARANGGAPVDVVTYPGAYHEFDHPSLTLRTQNGLAFTAGGSGAAHAGTDPAGRADAIRRVPAFLAR